MRKGLLLTVVLVAVGVCGSSALALDMLGPPTTSLAQGQWSIGGQYTYSQMDLTVEDYERDDSSYGDSKLKSTKIQKTYARFGYGVTDDCELTGLIGGSNAEFKHGIWDWVSCDYQMPFGGDMHFSWGLGTKVNLYEQSPDTKWGGIFQITWGSSRERLDYEGDGGYAGSADFDFYEIMFAVGPTHNLTDKVSVYGGPFVYFFRGNFDAQASGDTSSYNWQFNVEEETNVGGYVGVNFQLTEEASLNAEYLYNPDAAGFGAAFIWRL